MIGKRVLHLLGDDSAAKYQSDRQALLERIESITRLSDGRERIATAAQQQLAESQRVLSIVQAELKDAKADLEALRANPPGERDWSWAVEQIKAGNAVTHWLVSTHDYVGYVEKVGVMNDQTLILEAHNKTYSYTRMLMKDSDSDWRHLCWQAANTSGWEVYNKNKMARR